MATIRKNGLTVETNYEELQEKIQKHRKEVWVRTLKIVLSITLLIVSVELIYAIRSFNFYEVRNSIKRNNSSATQFAEYLDYILEYSNDGISCMGSNGELIWNQAFEMTTPVVETCGEYLVIYDSGGSKIYILTKAGLQQEIKTSVPIQTVCLAQQGTIAVLMKENSEFQVKLFDKKGKELANGKFYSNKGGFPIDIALSYDAKKLAVNMIDISQGKVNTTISFYNFDSVGQSQINNNVGTYTFEGILIPEIEYLSETRMLALGTGKIIIFEGKQKPEIAEEIEVKEEILSYFYNSKYIGMVYDNKEVENSRHIKVLDMNGNVKMENDTSIIYDNIEFLSNNEICV
ncbi:MAG: hypothetical protein IKJ01_05830, partial [Lachnospiraceae bacterium]|nr:hypothetical protein [Lachnospiraceae bacterium]